MKLSIFCLFLGWGIVAHAAPAGTAEFRSVLGKTPDLDHGAELFQQCSVCHGPNGGGSENGDIPRIAGQHFSVLVRQLVDYRHDARWDLRMQHYSLRKLLSDEQSLADVAGYVSQLTGDAPRTVGDGELTQHGRLVYTKQCASCHGTRGEGNAKDEVPRLAGQHYSYLLRQMHDAVDGRRPNISREHIRLLGKLDRDDLVGVADFLAREDWTGPVALLTPLSEER